MPDLFEKTTINTMTLANRFVRSATWEGLAGDDGSVTPALIERMAALARGETGLIITGNAFVSPEGRGARKQLGVYSDSLIEGLASMVKAVHDAGGRIALQLAHAGILADATVSGLPAVGPSLLEDHPACKELDTDAILSLVDSFAQAAVRAQKAGFDAVQVHAAHGYLLNEFLSPAFNHRTDAYGGKLENRARALLDVVAAVRAAVKPTYPVLVKINAEDFIENGLNREDSIVVASMLEKASADAVEISGGSKVSGVALMPARKGRIKTPAQEVYHREAAKIYKERVNIPLMLVGGIRSFGVAEELVRSGAADYISLARPLICEPDLVKRWHSGDRRPALCVSDNACYAPGFSGEGIRCVTFEKKRAHTAG